MIIETTWDTIIRTLAGFIVLLVLTRLLGKKQLGHMTIFTYITGIAMGNMAGDMVVHKDVLLSDGIISMTLWSILIFIVEYVSLKLPKARIILDGEPSIVIKKGLIMADELKKARLNIDDLTMLLRSKDIFSIMDVEYAILEPHGELSVLKKASKQEVVKEDTNIKIQNISYLPGEIISDGTIIVRNLNEFGKSAQWLEQELKRQGVNSHKDVLYAEIQNNGDLFVQKYL